MIVVLVSLLLCFRASLFREAETHLNYGVIFHRRFSYILLLVDCCIVKVAVVTSPVSSHCHGCCILSIVVGLCCYILWRL